jgi:hypothetical protein
MFREPGPRAYGAVGTVSVLLLRIGSDILRNIGDGILRKYDGRGDRIKASVDRVGLRLVIVW